jgi:Protein of unknown function (DUF1266).
MANKEHEEFLKEVEELENGVQANRDRAAREHAALQMEAFEQQKKMMEQQLAYLPPEQRAEIMKAFEAQGAAILNAYNGTVADEEEDEEFDEEEFQHFIEMNTPSPEHAKYLPIGALLIGTWGEPYSTLALISDEEDVIDALEGGWGIEDREDGLKMMKSLLEGRHANKFKADHLALKAGKRDKVDEDDAEDYDASVMAILEVLELPQSYVDNCNTLYAWDLERIGYLARLFAHVGFISDDEAWEWMKKAGAKIKENFDSWEAYIVSVLLGRGFAMGLAEEPYAVALDLLTDNRNFLDSHPIKNL